MAGFWPIAALILTTAHAAEPLRWGCDEEGGAPYCFKRQSGAGFERVGFEVDITKALSARLGRPITFTQYPFDNLVPGLKKRDFDLAMNGLEVTPDRRREILFSRPYYLYRQQLVCRMGESRFTDYSTLKYALPRARVGTMDATAAERILANDGFDVAGYPAPTEAYRDLGLGRLDAVLLDLPMAISYARKDKALAEAAALLIASKKIQAYWGEDEGD
jgi:polar amino acid transport system substrate-binding protein